MSIQETALEYLRRGFSVIPLNGPDEPHGAPVDERGKRPALAWKEYQARQPTEADVKKWFRNGRKLNLGVVTGAVSGITIVDFDSPEAIQFARERKFPKTPLVKTAKGYHAYCRYREGHRNFQKRADLPGIDLRGEGGYAVAPPSVHATGTQYEWVSKRGLDDVELAEVPDWIIAETPEDRTPIENVFKGAPDGNRNEALARVAGSVIGKGDGYDDALQFCLTWNTRNTPPLPEKEVEMTVTSIWEKHQRDKAIMTPCPIEENPSEGDSESHNWPALDQAAIPDGIVADFLDLACSNSEADPAAVLATFLVRFGIECGTGPHVMVGESRHTARSNCVIVGDSSKSRKGTSAGPVKSIFADIDGCRTSPGPLSSGEGIIYNVRDEVREWRVDKKSNAGEWVVADPGVDDKRLFVMDEEFANALSATKREGNTLSSIIRCLYDDGNAEPLTKSNRIKATGAHVGIVTHITLFELKTRLTENEQLNGFGNRFLWVCARRNGIVPFPEPMDDYKKQKLKVIMKERLDRAFVAGRMFFSDEAKALWAGEYARLSMAHSGLAGCMVNRAEAHVTRLSLIYSLIAGHDRIEVQDLRASMAFWEYCHQSAFYIFGGAPADRRKLRIMEYLRSRTGQCATKNEIRKEVFTNHIPATDLSELFTSMEADGLIDCITEPTGGAPRTMIILKHSSVKSVKSVASPSTNPLITLNTLKEQENSAEQVPVFNFDEDPVSGGAE